MLRNWTLRTRLIALVVALLAVTSIVIGGVMFLVLSTAMSNQFDSQLANDAQRITHGNGGPSARGELIDPGTIAVGFDDYGNSLGGGYFSSSTKMTALPGAQISALRVVPADGNPRSIAVQGYGDYRFVSVEAFGGRFVVGEPLSSLNRRIAGVLVTVVLVVLAAILLAAVLGAFIIGRALRPLRRVAAVASSVAAMRLDQGEVKVGQRVPEQDTNSHTEVGQVGAALNNLLDSVGSALAVRQASEEKVRAFVADASHELRTPLASIRGYAELTRRFGGELTDDVQHNIDRIESESKRMTALVEDLLLLARLDSQPELAAEDVDLSRLLVDVVSDAHAAGRDHRWDLELPDEPVLVRGDDARLHQVFTNLLANARVHTPPDTRVTVQLREPTGDTVTVLVRDSGPGIPPDLLPRLFGRFVRGDSSRNRTTGSTGLGLSIVSAVVQAQGGTVEVTSEPGDTAFRVTLPRAYAASTGAPAVTESASASA
ncbi:sensor histidine kinase [uncultured Amnibacterium sp.]|uniref:sensor histidine kinase n=1 Tax=uncultured Amnibacterium sp. TaxID=1631851 RepID=UPI0035CB47FB